MGKGPPLWRLSGLEMSLERAPRRCPGRMDDLEVPCAPSSQLMGIESIALMGRSESGLANATVMKRALDGAVTHTMRMHDRSAN